MHGPRPNYQVRGGHISKNLSKKLIDMFDFSDETPKCQLAALGETEFVDKIIEMQDKKWATKKKMNSVVIILAILACATPLIMAVYFIDNKIKELIYIYRIKRNIKYRQI